LLNWYLAITVSYCLYSRKVENNGDTWNCVILVSITTVRFVSIVFRSLFIWQSLIVVSDLSYFFELVSTSKTFLIEFGWIGRRCQTNHDISVADEDNELKFSKLFLAVWSKVWLECGWGRSVRSGEHVYSTRFPREASENRFCTLKLTPRRAMWNKSTQTDFKASLKRFKGAWTRA
jgi:hypothetical protein